MPKEEKSNSSLVNFVFQEAKQNMQFHFENMESLHKDSMATANLLYIVIAASLSAAVKLFAGGTHTLLALALSLMCIYLLVLGLILVSKCLTARNVEPAANEPKNLLKAKENGLSEDQAKEFELQNLQARIDSNRVRNEQTANDLKFVQRSIFLSPVVLLAAMFLAWVASALWRAVFG